MKKFLLFILTLCVTLTSCGKEKSFPFKTEDVKSIECYYYIIPAEAEKKVVSDTKEIENLIREISSVSLKQKKIYKTAGGRVISFKFILFDETYSVIYSSDGSKSGSIRFADENKTWFTSYDFESLWENINSRISKANTEELPSIE